jgi:hypothetical protein
LVKVIRSPGFGFVLAIVAGGGVFASSLLWRHHRFLGLASLVVGGICLAGLWADQAYEWRDDLRREGIERHTLERAALVTLFVGLPALVLFGLAIRVFGLGNPDPLNVAAFGVVFFIITAQRLRSKLTGE